MMNTIFKPTRRDRTFFFILLGVLLSVGSLYGYMLNQTVINIVERKVLAQELNNVNTDISELELAYIERKNVIADAKVVEFGLTTTDRTVFVERDRASRVTYNTAQ